MKTINALKVRTKFGQILSLLKRSAEPILVSKGGKVEAALVPIKLFEERFSEFLSKDKMKTLLMELETIRTTPKQGESSLEMLRELRGPLK